MRCYQVESFGLDHLQLAERPVPAPGPGQALVQIKAVSLNYRDLMMVQGVYNPKLKLPLIPCSDGAGVVLAVGEGVTRVQPGDRVMGIFSQTWISGPANRERSAGTLGGPHDGTLSEQRLFAAEGLVHTPAYLTDHEAATLPCTAVTAWHALVERGQLAAGETVLIQGTGGLSIAALQTARLLGARVIVTSSSDEKLARARALGASDGINYKKTPQWDKAVRELTGGVGVDHVVEVGGAGTLNQSLRAVRLGGHIAVIGVLGGASSTELSVVPVLMQNLRVNGVFVGNRDMFEALLRAYTLAGTRPVVDRVFPFAAARQAFDYLASGQHFGKIVIEIGN
ncbi:MAG: NAD(P)-dependent alcohol dehydrogenase [Bryobacteraceae bacterium]|nr:NAD(P)-dependent alcohol dehydrogenase [Bryobacteraceae bacterium]